MEGEAWVGSEEKERDGGKGGGVADHDPDY